MKWVKEIVAGLIESYDTNDVYELCDLLNIQIQRKENKNEIKSYFCRSINSDEFIFINKEMSFKEEKYLVAHELGHAILHIDLDTTYYKCNKLINKCKLERQADYFASELLLSSINLDDYIYEGQTISGLAYDINVLEEVLNYKLNIPY